MFKLEIVEDDKLPGCTYALVETVDGDFYGFVRQSRLNGEGMPQVLVKACALNASSAADAAAS